MMKRTMRLALILLLGGSLLVSGCTAQGEENSATESSSVVSENETGEADAPLYVADAALYRGEITDIQGNVYQLEMVNGRSYGEDVLMVTIGEDTDTYGIPEEGLQAGDYIEIYYDIVLESYPAQTIAIAVNYLAPSADQVVYNGVVQSAEKNTDGGWNILLIGDDSGQEALFRTGEWTQLYLNEEEIQPGAHLSILYSGIMTRSLPPQANAQEAALYTFERAEHIPEE